MMGSTRPAASLLLGGVLAAMCGKIVPAMEVIIPLYQYPGGEGSEGEMWKALKKEALIEGHKITGILNPSNGPNVDIFGGSDDLAVYQYILHTFLGKGTPFDTTEAPTGAPSGAPADAEPTEASTGDDLPPAGLTIICYVATDYGGTLPETVEADIDRYEELFPGVCDGIFFDETSADITDTSNIERGDRYQRYNNYVLTKNANEGLDWTVTFNPGRAIDPEFFDEARFMGSPTFMSYENFYAVMKKVGVPKPPRQEEPLAARPIYGEEFQHAMVVHTIDLDGATDASIQGIVRKAACAKWGKIYLTDDVLPNPWNALPSFWETLVAAVNSADGSDCPDQQTTLMVPLYLDSNPDAGAEVVKDLVAKTDYLEMKSVWAIVDTRDPAGSAVAEGLNDFGAKVLCYFNYGSYNPNNGLYPVANDLDAAAAKDCGGVFLDHFVDLGPFSEANFFALYTTVQNMIPRGTLVVNYLYPEATRDFNPFEKRWSEVSFRDGPVMEARKVDASSGSFELPSITGASSLNAALVVTGFTETDTETVECVLNEVAEEFNYAYVTGDATSTSATAYLERLYSEIETPTEPDCSVPTTPAPSTPAPSTPAPTTPAPTTPAPTTPAPTTPAPTTPAPAPETPEPATSTSCDETEDEARIRWSNSARKIIISGGGCADMTKISAYLDGQNIADPPLLDMGGGVWELDATIDVRANSVVRIMGEGGGGECNELRLLTDSTNGKRTRVFGNQGSIEIKNTKVVGWVRADGMVDGNNSALRGFVYCSSCPGSSTGQCVMNVENSEIGYLGAGGQNTGGLIWRDRCSSKADAIANDVQITGNHRGIYAYGPVLKFDNLDITGSGVEGIRADTVSGHIKTSTVNQDTSTWAIHINRPAGLEIADSIVTGSRSLYLGTPGSSPPKFTRNTLDASSRVRVKTTDTIFQENTGGSNIRVLKGGCFAASSTGNTDGQAYIDSNSC